MSEKLKEACTLDIVCDEGCRFFRGGYGTGFSPWCVSGLTEEQEERSEQMSEHPCTSKCPHYCEESGDTLGSWCLATGLLTRGQQFCGAAMERRNYLHCAAYIKTLLAQAGIACEDDKE
jgi:hypothetical protein